MSLYRNYGLKSGEPVEVTEHQCLGDKRKYRSVLYQQYPPDSIRVVREYPEFIHLRGTWSNILHTYEYDVCVEKAAIYCGDITVTRLRTDEQLEAGELLSD